ncbi:MAG TPA: hypothetical protein VEA80_13195 [Vitreimonas sp.]|uniref:hypothetical protein n=1 Tax=Vitreimonas sp. TaxID=3069702 RepID=UPI002D2FECBD|nr:hypothetical protein [Vitreimonas sp.]HYD88425.1 hypothetical protein [Vitreimonas sp.]
MKAHFASTALTALAFLCMLGLGAEAQALEIAERPLAADELDELRGGFLLPNGVEADLGAVARTFSNGQLLLETHVSWTENGVTSTEVFRAEALASAGEALPQGFSLSDADGLTLIAHQIDDGGLRNVVLNEASNRDLSLQIDVTLALPDFALAQQDFRASVTAFRLGDELSTAMIFGGL